MTDETHSDALALNTEAVETNTATVASNTETVAITESNREALALRADALTRAVDEFKGELNLGRDLEERQSGTEGDVRRQKRLTRWLIFSVVLDVCLSVGLIFFGIAEHQSEHDLCHATQRSWDTRARTAEIITTPTALSPKIEQLLGEGDLVKTLRLQIAQSNQTRATQRAELTSANGPRPNC